MKIKLKYWCGSQAIFARKSPWMLGFGFFIASACLPVAQAQAPTIGLRVVVTAAVGLEPAHIKEHLLKQDNTFQFVVPTGEPIKFGCETSRLKGNRARVSCVAGPEKGSAWRESFEVSPLIGRCDNTAIQTPDKRAVSLAICESLDQTPTPYRT